MSILAHFETRAGHPRVDEFVLTAKIVDANLIVTRGEYGFNLWTAETPRGARHWRAVKPSHFEFATRDERQAAILALCELSEREGFALTIS